jgi:hypothetical protein
MILDFHVFSMKLHIKFLRSPLQQLLTRSTIYCVVSEKAFPKNKIKDPIECNVTRLCD